MIKIHIFHTGKVKVDVAIPYKERNPLAAAGFFRGEDKKTELPVSCYLIEPPRGRVLIDSGWNSKYVTEKPHRFFGLLDQISTPILEPGESIDCQLANMHLKPSDINYLFFSHLDFDHTSGLALLEGVRSVQAAEEEIADAKKYFYRYVRKNWEFADLKPFYYDKTGIGPVGKSHDVFQDGSVLLVNTPGHSHGISARSSAPTGNMLSWREMRFIRRSPYGKGGSRVLQLTPGWQKSRWIGSATAPQMKTAFWSRPTMIRR